MSTLRVLRVTSPDAPCTRAGRSDDRPWVVEHVYQTFGYHEVLATVNHHLEQAQAVGEVEVLPIAFTINLAQGWNMVSLPVLGWGYTSNTLGLSFGDVVVGWDSLNQTYGQAFIVGLSPPSTAFEIREGVGYWVYVSVAKTLILYGSNLTETHSYQWTVPVGGGWVMVGFPQTGATLWASDVPGMCDNPDAVAIVARFNAATQIYQSYIPMFPPTDFTLIPGEGYWVYLSESVTATYGP